MSSTRAMPCSTGMSTMQEKRIAYFSFMGTTWGYALPASRSSMQLSSLSPRPARASLTRLLAMMSADCSMNSLTSLAVGAAPSARGRHLSMRRTSPTALAMPIPPTFVYAGSVLVILPERGRPDLIRTVTRCPTVGTTITEVSGSENRTPSSISFEMRRASSGSMRRPARRSVMIWSSSMVAKFPRRARSPVPKVDAHSYGLYHAPPRVVGVRELVPQHVEYGDVRLWGYSAPHRYHLSQNPVPTHLVQVRRGGCLQRGRPVQVGVGQVAHPRPAARTPCVCRSCPTGRRPAPRYFNGWPRILGLNRRQLSDAASVFSELGQRTAEDTS